MIKHRIIVMGVSGCGKTTIGDLVARELGVPFVDGDSLHPVENVAKMAAGTPLTDEDRWPWLATVGSKLAAAGDGGLVLACSALRRSYRDAIREQAPDTVFLQRFQCGELGFQQRRRHEVPGPSLGPRS